MWIELINTGKKLYLLNFDFANNLLDYYEVVLH